MSAIGAITKRTWLPLVVTLAAAAGAMAVINLRGAFGSDEIFGWDGSGSTPIASINEKRVVYEIFGPHGATGGVSYLDEQTRPVQSTFTALPWSLTMTTTNPAVVGNLVAQSDADGIGCRITVNGDIKDEQHATGHHAQVFCLVKAA
ncbi:MmpS family transport accessory protein [Mycobacterium sp. CSUR Q5927]|nr:MmpS family transport accessory protein [Mycobacterium sp. CSUR Q5927]